MIIPKYISNHDFDPKLAESPIEEIFLSHLPKFMNWGTKIVPQKWFETMSGKFRVDIALERNGSIVVIECDGEEHHTKEMDTWYDEWRDTLLLVQNKVKTIYRVRGRDIHYSIREILFIINQYDPFIFYKKNAARLPSHEIEESFGKKIIHYNYEGPTQEIASGTVEIVRKNVRSNFDLFWTKYVLYSLNHPEKNIMELIQIMKEGFYTPSDLMKMVNKKHPLMNITNQKQLLTPNKSNNFFKL